MSTYFFTGFPGYIATNLIRELMKSSCTISKIYVLVLPQMQTIAEQVCSSLLMETQSPIDQIQLIFGDITEPNLGLEQNISEDLQQKIDYVYHLAAIYDLAVPQEIAYQVNVMGTKHVTDWTRGIYSLKRYVYFSTAYVSGTREGRIMEQELVMGQGFKNFYEETKYHAEVIVQEAIPMIPTTIIRPGIVKGHSITGVTTKFDGPYFMLNVFERLKFLPIIPFMGNSNAIGNFVPIDYIFLATLYLGHQEVGIGKTYHLTDPHAYTMKEAYGMLLSEYLGKKPIGTIPLSPIRLAMQFAWIRKWLGVEKEAFDYFTYVTIYDTTQAESDLIGSGICLPNFKESLPAMVQFYREHKHRTEYHIKIT